MPHSSRCRRWIWAWGAVLTLCASAAWAQKVTVYSWLDAQGVRHYGDVATSPARANRLVLRTARTATSGAAAPVSPAPASANPVEDERPEVRACRVAQGNRSLLADPGKNVLAEDGQSVLTPEARAQQLTRASAEVDAYCNVLGGR